MPSTTPAPLSLVPADSPRRALLSVSDKRGLVDLARSLAGSGVQLCSTGGTARTLRDAGLEVSDIAEITGFPEIMDGRVKTLHPLVFGGILARRDEASDLASADQLGIPLFDFVVVNLYPFRETVSREQVALADAVENIDIGGPSLVRAAAKNHRWTTVLTAPEQYPLVIAELEQNGQTTPALRRRLMVEAFAHTASYDAAVQAFFASQFQQDLPEADREIPTSFLPDLQRTELLRYGENPHQAAGVFVRHPVRGPSVVTARQLHGKALSYNNLLDLDAALAIVARMDVPAAAVLKHNNPCGAAVGERLEIAIQRAFAGDPVSAFGSVVGVNRVVDTATARWLSETSGLFVEAILAPDFAPEALRWLREVPKWKNNVRLMATGPFQSPTPALEFRSIAGGALVQTSDTGPDEIGQWKTVTRSSPEPQLLADLALGWAVVRAVKSNAIVLVREGSVVGVGAGQMSRVDSVRIAIQKAGERARGSVLASDAFFPFPDSVELAREAGIAALIQPGGSVKDAEVIAAADLAGIPMLFTGRRHFRH